MPQFNQMGVKKSSGWVIDHFTKSDLRAGLTRPRRSATATMTKKPREPTQDGTTGDLLY